MVVCGLFHDCGLWFTRCCIQSRKRAKRWSTFHKKRSIIIGKIRYTNSKCISNKSGQINLLPRCHRHARHCKLETSKRFRSSMVWDLYKNILALQQVRHCDCVFMATRWTSCGVVRFSTRSQVSGFAISFVRHLHTPLEITYSVRAVVMSMYCPSSSRT